MPATVSISITTNNISTVNKIRMAIYKDSAPLVMVQYIDEIAGAHLMRTWNFAGLERVMHFYKLLEVDGSNNVISTLIGPIYFLPSDETIEVKDAKLIQAGTTIIPGSDPATAWPVDVFDVFVPEWIGWDLEMFERVGQGSLKYDISQPVDMSWNSSTGYLHLNQTDDVFQQDEWFIARFKVRVTTTGATTLSSANGFSDILVVTVNTILTSDDVGKKILIDPAANYLEITLPNALSVAALRLMYFEMANSFTHKCAKIKAVGETGQYIQFLEGDLTEVYICPSETLELYMRSVLSVVEWRVNNAYGNFKSVGEIVYHDMATVFANTLNRLILNGAPLDVFQYARLYNRFILRLPASTIAYSAWSGVNETRYKHSLKDTVSNNFHIADARNVYDRGSSGANTPGDYQRMMIERHKHIMAWGESHDNPLPAPNQTSNAGHVGSGSTDFDNYLWFTNDGSNNIFGNSIDPNAAGIIGEETRPISRITNKYILI